MQKKLYKGAKLVPEVLAVLTEGGGRGCKGKIGPCLPLAIKWKSYNSRAGEMILPAAHAIT